MTLYEIATEYKEFLMQIDEIPEEAIADTLELIDGEFELKADNIACVYKEMLVEMKALKEEAKILLDRAKAKEAKSQRLKEYLFQQMREVGKKKIETSRNVIAIRSNPVSVNVSPDFLTWARKNNRTDLLKFSDPTPDKTEIKKLLQNGKDVPYAELTKGERIDIK